MRYPRPSAIAILAAGLVLAGTLAEMELGPSLAATPSSCTTTRPPPTSNHCIKPAPSLPRRTDNPPRSSLHRQYVGRLRGGTALSPLRAKTPRSGLTRVQQATLFRRWLFAQPGFMLSKGRARLLDSWQIRLIDGDTFAYGMERIRIRGFNAPETSESGGFEATQRMDLLLHEGPVTVVPQALDVYKRVVADVYVNDRNVAEVMVEEGYAKSR